MTGFVKVTVDFLVKSEDSGDAKNKIDLMMRSTYAPVYTIRPETESAAI
jgi:hypothetical protein